MSTIKPSTRTNGPPIADDVPIVEITDPKVDFAAKLAAARSGSVRWATGGPAAICIDSHAPVIFR